jgi:hypothetical protein
MRFTEFEKSQPQLTEEQQIVIEYCQGNISKKDAVSRLKEAARLQTPIKQPRTSDFFTWNKQGGLSGLNWGGDWRDQLNKLTFGAVDSRDEQDAQDAEAMAQRDRGRQNMPFARLGQGGALAADPEGTGIPRDIPDPEAGTGIPSKIPAPDPAPAPEKPKAPTSFGAAFKAARKAHGGPGGVFTWNGKKYQTNVKGEKYVKNPVPVKIPQAPKPKKPGLSPGALGGKAKPGLSPGALGGKLPPKKEPGLSPGALGGKVKKKPKPKSGLAPMKIPGTMSA